MKIFSNSKVSFKENVEYVLRGKDGKIKKIFQANKFYLWLLKNKLVSANLKFFPFGHYADKMVLANLITNAGLVGVAGRINGSGAPAAFTYIALGIGTTAANAADVALVSEITTYGGARASATASLVQTTIANDTAQLQKTFDFTAGASFAVTESGVFNAASSVTLLARQVFSAINVADGDSLQITWKVSVAEA